MSETEATQKVDTEDKAVMETAQVKQPEAPKKKVVARRSKASRRRKPTVRMPKPEVDTTPTDQKTDNRTTEKMIKDGITSINTALVQDENGPIKMKFPVMRDPEAKQMIYETRTFRTIDVPYDEVVYYTQNTIIDMHADHTCTVVVGNRRTAIVFDRTYTFKNRVYNRCAWIPDKILRAGTLFEKKIDRVTRQPIAVLKKLPGTNTEMYQIVGNVQTDYRDLKRIFERVFIKKGIPTNIQEDNELIKFMHDSVPPDEMEVGS